MNRAMEVATGLAKACLAALALVPAGAPPASAQVAEFGVHAGSSTLSSKLLGSIRLTQPAQTVRVLLNSGFRVGFRVSLNNYRYFGNEFGYAYNRSSLRADGAAGSLQRAQGMAIHNGGYNFLMYATPEGKPLRPFFTGGGHFNNYVPPGASAIYGQGSVKYGYNYGAGVKIRVAPMFAIRLDYRQYVNGKPFDYPDQSGLLRQSEISAGFSFVL